MGASTLAGYQPYRSALLRSASNKGHIVAAGRTVRVFMADGGEVKYYLPPRLAAAPPAPAAAASGGEAAGEALVGAEAVTDTAAATAGTREGQGRQSPP